MKRMACLALLSTLIAIPSLSFGQATNLDTWIDATFDGLPDNPSSPKSLAIGLTDSFDIWMNSSNFPGGANWTNFNYFFRVGPDGPDSVNNFFANDTASVLVVYDTSGPNGVGPGTFFPEDNFSVPYGFGLGGFGFNSPAATRRLARVKVRAVKSSTPGGACIEPITDIYASNFCSLGAGTAYGVFSTGTVTKACWTIQLNAVEPTSWGQVKGLFR